jgi:hypothetical protein
MSHGSGEVKQASRSDKAVQKGKAAVAVPRAFPAPELINAQAKGELLDYARTVFVGLDDAETLLKEFSDYMRHAHNAQGVRDTIHRIGEMRRPKERIIFRSWRRAANGRRMFASDYGHKAWPIRIKG